MIFRLGRYAGKAFQMKSADGVCLLGLRTPHAEHVWSDCVYAFHGSLSQHMIKKGWISPVHHNDNQPLAVVSPEAPYHSQCENMHSNTKIDQSRKTSFFRCSAWYTLD